MYYTLRVFQCSCRSVLPRAKRLLCTFHVRQAWLKQEQQQMKNKVAPGTIEVIDDLLEELMYLRLPEYRALDCWKYADDNFNKVKNWIDTVSPAFGEYFKKQWGGEKGAHCRHRWIGMTPPSAAALPPVETVYRRCLLVRVFLLLLALCSSAAPFACLCRGLCRRWCDTLSLHWPPFLHLAWL